MLSIPVRLMNVQMQEVKMHTIDNVQTFFQRNFIPNHPEINIKQFTAGLKNAVASIVK
jgi:hypothetical protein